MTKKSLISVGVIGLLSVSVLVLGGVVSWADEVERMQVQIMTLDGKQLMEQEYYGAHVNPLSSLYGQPLADGVYLLVVRSRDANGNVMVRVQKFAVLRGRVHISRPNAGLQNDLQGRHKLQPQNFKVPYIVLKMVDILPYKYKKVATIKLSQAIWLAEVGAFLVCTVAGGGPHAGLLCKVVGLSLLATSGVLELNLAPNSDVDVYCRPMWWLSTFPPPCFIVPKGVLEFLGR